MFNLSTVVIPVTIRSLVVVIPTTFNELLSVVTPVTFNVLLSVVTPVTFNVLLSVVALVTPNDVKLVIPVDSKSLVFNASVNCPLLPLRLS